MFARYFVELPLEADRVERALLREPEEWVPGLASKANHHGDALLAEVERTGVSVTITSLGTQVAVLSPAYQRLRRFGQLPTLVVPDNFDEPLPAAEVGQPAYSTRHHSELAGA